MTIRGSVNIETGTALAPVSHWPHPISLVKPVSSFLPSFPLLHPLHLVTLLPLLGSELTGNLVVLSLCCAQLEAGKAGVLSLQAVSGPLLEERLLRATSGLLRIRLARPHFLCSGRLDTA